MSQRRLWPAVSRCCGFEFEDVIREVDDADLIAPQHRRFSPLLHRVLNRVGRHSPLLITSNPGFVGAPLRREYDLFFVVCQCPSDLLALNSLRGWRSRCRQAICLIEEMWTGRHLQWKGHLRLLAKFDHVFLSCAMAVDALQERIGVPCSYMPTGVAALEFCPYPDSPERVIDVCSIGRRSSATHRALLEWAANTKRFYLFDTFAAQAVIDAREHRLTLANIIKRSRYFIANRAKINRSWETSDQEEIGFRFFEGIAGGAILIGDPPRTDHFRHLFHWDDAVIRIGLGDENIGGVLEDLESQPDRIAAIRRKNVTEALLRHDWLYRWDAVLKAAGLTATAAADARRRRLEELTEGVLGSWPWTTESVRG